MRSLTMKIIQLLLIKSIGITNIEKLILLLARLVRIDLLILSYKSMGILKYWNSAVSGEDFVITNVIKKFIQKEDPTIFDVGANVGDYSRKVREEFPSAEIYAFEPNPASFELLTCNLSSFQVNCHKLGIGSNSSKQKIYSYSNEVDSQHASVYKNVLLDLHKANDIVEMEFNNTTLDEFCESNGIHSIDFIKIDTEGHELEVLKGGRKMISEDRISMIQFEFNEMNIISRVFLKDFYEILQEYDIYRLNSNNLVPLLEYSSSNEIFKFQNFLAINRKISLVI